jgi:RNA polymerase sigma-70 factor (ECF subfamily)
LGKSTLYLEKELLQQIAAGDEKAFCRVFSEHWQNIYGVAFMLTKSAVLAEDMVQEIFLKIWIKRAHLPEVENFRNFLFVVARNHIFSELRKQSNEVSFTEQLIDYFTETRKDPEKALVHKQASEMISKAIEQLSPQQRVVYELSRDKGLTRDQIARQMGISPNTVRNHMAGALEQIRQYLQRHADGFLFTICIIETFLSV